MTPKPQERVPKGRAMTIAIGARCTGGGAVLIADRNIVMSDGSKTTGCKIYSRDLSNGHVALASSTDDGLAAECLARQIMDDIEASGCINPRHMVDRACVLMHEWFNSYGQNTPPGICYLMAACANGEQCLYVIEPPSTYVEKHTYAIGSGARVAQSRLEHLIQPQHYYMPEPTLMYLVYLAKHTEDEEAYIGGGFDALYVPQVGNKVSLDGSDLSRAADLVPIVDQFIDRSLQLLLWRTDQRSTEKAAASRERDFIAAARQLSDANLFPALRGQ